MAGCTSQCDVGMAADQHVQLQHRDSGTALNCPYHPTDAGDRGFGLLGEHGADTGELLVLLKLLYNKQVQTFAHIHFRGVLETAVLTQAIEIMCFVF